MSKGHTDAWILLILISKPHLPMDISPANPWPHGITCG